jgi:hypothetical protein
MALQIILWIIFISWGVIGYINHRRINRIARKYKSTGLFNPLVPMEKSDKKLIIKYFLYDLIAFIGMGILAALSFAIFAWSK